MAAPNDIYISKADAMNRFQTAGPLKATVAISLIATSLTLVQAQVVQLPSSRSLGYSGSVWVPDGGSTTFGGSSTGSYGSRSGGGWFANRAAGSSLGGESLTASVQIIDLVALDEAILASGGGSRSAQASGPASEAGSSSDAATAPSVETPSPTQRLAEPSRPPRQANNLIDRQSPRIGADPGKWQRVLSGAGNTLSRVPSQLESDIRYYVRQGEAAESAGHLMAARVYYKLARDLMTPELVARYDLIVTQRREAEEARRKAEIEAVRRKF